MYKYELDIEFKVEGVVSMTLPNIVEFWTDKTFLITTNLMGTKYFIPRENILYYSVKEEFVPDKKFKDGDKDDD